MEHSAQTTLQPAAIEEVCTAGSSLHEKDGSRRERLTAAVGWMARPTAIFAITRLGILAVAFLAAILLPANADPAPYHLRGTDNVLVDVFGSRWDTGFYVSIAEDGYTYEADPFPSVPFFPLLPLLMRLAAPLTGGDVVPAGLLVANLALWGATLLFYRLATDEYGTAVAARAVWYMLIFPTAFFGSAIYTESLFLLTAIGALYAARRGHWWLAGVLGVGTALTRLVGVIVAPLLFVEWWQQRLGDAKAAPWWSLPATALPALGTVGYSAYLWRAFGDPLGFMTGSAAWGRVAQSPFQTVAALFERPAAGWGPALAAGQIHVNDWFDFLMVLSFLGAGLVLIGRRRWSEGLFVWLGVMIPFSSGLLMSQRRYMWVLFPVFLLLARWGDRGWVDRLITTVFLLLLALFTALFANMYWVA